ncbi:MAG TPA: helix-turn-helix domain-containing protein [Pseudomonas sp.]|nr:helix-turn-helix domain-containing protein [Pseudomonas sp.]
MSGLRERQKAERRQAISAAAVALFDKQGYQATTIEQIARAAGVSAPTVFAYFNSKQEIVLEMLREADRLAVRQARRSLTVLDNPVDALCQIERRIVEYAFQMLPAALWRELLPMIIGQLGTNAEGLPHAYRQVNDVLVAELISLLQDLKSAGALRADLDANLVAFLLNDYGHVQFLRLANQDPPDFAAHSHEVRQFITLLFQGMQAR